MSEAKAAIVPHKKGLDISGDDSGNIYIIRSDLLCYLKCNHKLEQNCDSSKKGGQEYTVFPLHPSCSEGDHYIREPSSAFTIIKGSTFFTVSDLTTPSGTNVEEQPLSSYCQGELATATGVLRFGGQYYIIQGDSYLTVSSFTSDSSSAKGQLYTPFAKGLYYYSVRSGNKESIGIVTQNDNAVIYWMTTDLTKGGRSRFIYPNLVNFLPGGYSINYGVASPNWELFKCFQNDSDTTLQWSQAITKTVGYKKSEFQSIEHNWKVTAEVSMGTSFEVGFLVPATIEMQFSLSTSYGGASIKTSQEDWSEQHEINEQLSLEIGAGKTVYVWQYRLGFSQLANSFLYCRDIAITNTNTPPVSAPFKSS